MYSNNIYVRNHETIKKYAGDIGVQTGVPELLSVEDKQLLGL